MQKLCDKYRREAEDLRHDKIIHAAFPKTSAKTGLSKKSSVTPIARTASATGRPCEVSTSIPLNGPIPQPLAGKITDLRQDLGLFLEFQLDFFRRHVVRRPGMRGSDGLVFVGRERMPATGFFS
jgi:hypothetical protein